MKSTGIVRKIDALGRVVLPIELRRVMGLDIKDPIEIFVHNETIVLRAYRPGCEFCTATDNLVDYEGRKVCKGCIEKMDTLMKRGEN